MLLDFLLLSLVFEKRECLLSEVCVILILAHVFHFVKTSTSLSQITLASLEHSLKGIKLLGELHSKNSLGCDFGVCCVQVLLV